MRLRKGYKGKHGNTFSSYINKGVKLEMAGKRGFAESRVGKTVLVLLTAFLIFAGPTYVVYVLQSVAGVSYAISMLSGLILFVIGLVLLWYLIRNRIVPEEQ